MNQPSLLTRAARAKEAVVSRTRAGANETGQAMVEFAFTFSIFILLFFGFLGLAIVFFAWLTTASAAREGARFVVANPSATDTEVIQQICQTSIMLGGSEANCNSQVAAGELVITIEPATRGPDTQVTVTVRYHVPVPTLQMTFLNGAGFTFLAPIWVQSVAVMRVSA